MTANSVADIFFNEKRWDVKNTTGFFLSRWGADWPSGAPFLAPIFDGRQIVTNGTNYNHESGSGKSTLGRMLVGLLEPSSGQVRRDGVESVGLVPGVQMVFQDPVSSLNPRRSVGESIADPLRAAGERDQSAIRDRVGELLLRVGLEEAHYDRYPHEFSGGQRQRVGIARALAPRPRLIVCDEPVSALDVTTQAQVTALLAELQQELGIALVFIAHDLAVVRQVSDRVAVMRGGVIVEEGPVDEVYDRPAHAYTRELLAAVPSLDPALAAARRLGRRRSGGVLAGAS